MGKQRTREEELENRQTMMGQLASQKTKTMFGLQPDTRAFHTDFITDTDKEVTESEVDKVKRTNDVLERFKQENALNLEMKAKNQSGWAQLGNSLVKMAAKAGTTTAVTAGSIFGFGNELAEWAADVDKEAEKKFPNYRTQEEQDTSWYKRMFTPKYMANFWGDDVIKNMGFTLGAVWGARFVTAPLRMAERAALRSIARDAAYAVETSNNREAATNTVARILGANAPEKAAIDLSRYLNTQKTFTFAEELLGSVAASFGEASIEAKSVYNEFVDSNNKSLTDYLQRNIDTLYKEYSSNVTLRSKYKTFDAFLDDKVTQSTNDINELANGAASTTFALNIPILMAENLLVWRKMFSGGFKNSSLAKSELDLGSNVSTTLGEGGVVTARNTFNRVKRFWDVSKRSIYEGSQEMFQYWASSGSKYFFGSKLNDYLGYQLNKDYNDKAVTAFKAFGKGFADTFLNEDAWMEGFVGALTTMVGIPSIRITGRVTDQNGKKKVLPFKFSMEGSLRKAIQYTNAKYKKIQEVVDLINNHLGSDEAVNNYKQFVRQIGLNEEMKDALMMMDKLTYKDKEYQSLFSLATHLYDVGRVDAVNNLLDMAGNMSEEDYNTLIKDIRENTEGETVFLSFDDFKKEVKDLKKTITEAIEIKQKVDERFKGSVSDDMLNFLSSALAMSKNKLNRVKSILDTHSKILGPAKIYITQDTNINELIATIGDVLYGKTTPDKWKDLTVTDIIDNVKKAIKGTNTMSPDELDSFITDLMDVHENLVDFQEYSSAYTYGMYNPEKLGGFYEKIVRDRFRQIAAEQQKQVEDTVASSETAEELGDKADTAGADAAADTVGKANPEVVKQWKDIKSTKKAIRDVFDNALQILDEYHTKKTITDDEHKALSEKLNTYKNFVSEGSNISSVETLKLSQLSNSLTTDIVNLISADPTRNDVLMKVLTDLTGLFDSGSVFAQALDNIDSLYNKNADEIEKKVKTGEASKHEFIMTWIAFLTNNLATKLVTNFQDEVELLKNESGRVTGVQTINHINKDFTVYVRANFARGELSVLLKQSDIEYTYVVSDCDFIFGDTSQSESDIVEKLCTDIFDALSVEGRNNIADKAKSKAYIKMRTDLSSFLNDNNLSLPICYEKLSSIFSKFDEDSSRRFNEFIKNLDAFKSKNPDTKTVESEQTTEDEKTDEQEKQGEEQGSEQEEPETNRDVTPRWDSDVKNTNALEFDSKPNSGIKERHIMTTKYSTGNDKDDQILEKMRNYGKSSRDGMLSMYDFVNQGNIQKLNLLDSKIHFRDITDEDFGVKVIGGYITLEEGNEQLVSMFRADTTMGAYLDSLGKDKNGTYKGLSSIEKFVYGSEQFSIDYMNDDGGAVNYHNMSEIKDLKKAMDNKDVGFFFMKADDKGTVVVSRDVANSLQSKMTEKGVNDGDIGRIKILMPKTSTHLAKDPGNKIMSMDVIPIGISELLEDSTKDMLLGNGSLTTGRIENINFAYSELFIQLQSIFRKLRKVAVSGDRREISAIQNELNALLAFSVEGENGFDSRVLLADTIIEIDLAKDNSNEVTIGAYYSERVDGEKTKMAVTRNDHEMIEKLDLSNIVEGTLNFLLKLNPFFSISDVNVENMRKYIDAGVLQSGINERVYPFNTYFVLSRPVVNDSAKTSEEVVDGDSEETHEKPVGKGKKTKGGTVTQTPNPERNDNSKEASFQEIKSLINMEKVKNGDEELKRLIDTFTRRSKNHPLLDALNSRNLETISKLIAAVQNYKNPPTNEASESHDECIEGANEGTINDF